jgi:acyl carrier protein
MPLSPPTLLWDEQIYYDIKPFLNMETTIITKEQIREQLLAFLSRQFMVPINEIELDKSLVDTGVIDSMGLIEISAYIEKNYLFRITEDMMIRDNFGSVYKITDFITRQINLE